METYKNKKVLIFGLGTNQGGVGSAKFFAKQGAIVRITDIKSKEDLQPSIDQLKEFRGIEYFLKGHREKDFDWADLIIKNPAVKPNNKFLIYARNKGKRIETDISIFLNFINPQRIIGITGTKGKSTTASLIFQILKSVNKNVVFAGNIGTSVLDIIDKVNDQTLIILELSSFQLEGFKIKLVSPHWALITNIFRDHLNYYSSMDEYISAKRIICKYQKSDDFLIIGKDDPIADTYQFTNGLQSQIIKFSADNLPKNFSSILQGEHNLKNIAAAYQTAKMFNVEDKLIFQILSSFQSIEFRLQIIKEWNKVKIINDTAATNPNAAIQALKSYPNSILITGGQNANLDYGEFAEAINKYAKSAYLLPGDATEIFKSKLVNVKDESSDLRKLLTEIKNEIRPGDVILFSPGAKSFNSFKNEFDRGRKFNQIVSEIFKDSN